MGCLVLSIMSAFADFERELIRERAHEGIARARAEGKSIGQRGPDTGRLWDPCRVISSRLGIRRLDRESEICTPH